MQLPPGFPQYTSDLEATLLSELFSGNYSTVVRPSSLVAVNVSFMLYTINDLNIVDQTLSVSGMLSMRWLDPRLAWITKHDYTPVPFLFNTEENTWTPAIYVENSVEDLSVINDENMPMRIKPNGEVRRTPAGVFKVSCECDVTYYPFDKQTCHINLTTSGYTQGEIDLHYDEIVVDLSDYVMNGEWDIVSAWGSSLDRTRTRNGFKFATLSFGLQLKRRYLFHTINTIFPVFLMGMLIPFVFKLRVIEEKIGYSLTVLLSYAVYLTLIADHIPSTSVSVCYLSVYLAVVLTTSTLSILIVITGSRVSTHQGGLSPCTKAFAYCLAKMFCARRSCYYDKTDNVPEGKAGEFYINRNDNLSSKEFMPEEKENLPNDDRIVLLWQLQPGHTQYTSDLEATLLSDLFSGNYSTLVRPSAVVTVNVSFMLYTINDLNIVDQTLSVSGMLTMNWLDPRLVWANDSDYSSVLFLFNTEENTWTPAIYVENSVEDLAVINDENMPMRIMPNGEVSRTPAGVFQVSCESDVTYYPFDKQTCNIKITTSGYTQGEIDLNFNENAVDLSAYVTNGEWEIVSAGGLSTGGQSRTRNGLTFASLSFQFVLKRRYVFHTINTIFPVFLMGILIPFVFKLEEIADKIGYSLTVLLSYAVYLTVIADHIPSTSVAVCYLCKLK
ncbi:neuronal acetylcholine receptor subunit alpha-5-like [Saccostrea echinata]|uniref:neuronal acetylcholine receptor subunit alpha-5-like n=1 Tax=Saccostrea echinata TaxID=191078 RepID=UPI002A813158|nr:neuronal acetylcholine receptor subunit alpha-5-like [Saccostrea echinata]